MRVSLFFSIYLIYTLFYKQHFYKQRQAEIGGKKVVQMLSNTLTLNVCYLKVIHFLQPRYYSKIIIGHILKNKQKNKCVCIYTINHNENENENEK